MGPIRDASAAAKALEATFLRQLIESSGAFKGHSMAGGELHGQMFVNALADAVEARGGLGLARLIEDALPASAEPDASTESDATSQGAADELTVGKDATSEPAEKVINRSSALKAYRDRADLLSNKRPTRLAKGIGHDH